MEAVITEAEPTVGPAAVREGPTDGESHPAIGSPPICPQCQSGHVHRHGFYIRKDGSRPQRFICQACAKSFNPSTGTTLAYAKKRAAFHQFAATMGAGSPLRKQAAALGIHVSTAFRWRHRVLARVAGQPQPRLTGQVAIGEAYVAFSQKGQRVKPQCPHPFIQRLPSRILLIAGNPGHRMAVVGAGRSGANRRHAIQLGDDLLEACLREALGPDAQVHTDGPPVFTRIYRRVGLTVCHSGI